MRSPFGAFHRFTWHCRRQRKLYQRQRQISQDIVVWYNGEIVADDGDDRVRVLNEIRDFIQQDHGVLVHEYGAGPSGTAIWNSDIDLCVTNAMNAEERYNLLMQIRDELIIRGYEIRQLNTEEDAMSLVCKDMVSKIRADINLSDDHQVKTIPSRYLRFLTDRYHKCKQMICLVKGFLYEQELNTRGGGPIANIIATYMVIYYLQKNGDLPIILQNEKPHNIDGFAVEAENFENRAVDGLRKYIATYLRGFFEFYAEEFDFVNLVISIRSTTQLRKEDDWANAENCLVVLDPFSIGYQPMNKAVGVQIQDLEKMKGVFQRAAKELGKGNV